MLKAFFSSLLLLPSFVFAAVSYSELILQDEKGNMLSQVSGLGKFDKWLVVLVQDKNALYLAEQKQLSNAFTQKQQSIRLKPVTIMMDELQTSSWEAVEFATVDDKHYIFLFHEHDFDGDNHQVYSAQVQLKQSEFTLSKLNKLGPALPLLQSDKISLARRENYGYEAIVWQPNSQQLLLLPELKTQPKFTLDLAGNLRPAGIAEHKLRASDLTSVSNQCAIATSFCYQSGSFTDALCEGNNGSPKLSLATFRKSQTHLKLVDTIDATKQLMPVGYDPDYSSSVEKARTFNAEGIVSFQDGFLLANDNKPQGKSRSVLRYVSGITVDPISCEFND